jgi:predicted CXXCH cytochrome family protein
MAGDDLTQKQIAGKYHSNLSYFAKGHYLRRWRGWCFAIAVIGSIAGLATFRFWGTQEAFSTGPISANHTRLAKDCQACHLDARTDFLKTLSGLRTVAFSASDGTPMKPHGGDSGVLSRTSISLMDQACLQCHPMKGLHLPQAAGLALRTVSSEMNVVHASSCAVCHREHVGPERMALPERQTCLDCHNDPEALRPARRSLKLDAPPVAASGENRDLGDGAIRYIAHPKPVGSLQAFPSYAEGHPPFGYERPEARDPGQLKFNHARHLRGDLPQVNGKNLDCASCHQPGANGVFYQPIRYEKHCQQCHSLQLQPSLPDLRVPHGDAEKVRYFLASLPVSFEATLRASGVTEPDALAQRVDEEMQALRRRGLYSLPELENRVFFQGDPQNEEGARLERAGNPKFLTECLKCHNVVPSDGSRAPVVHPPLLADRWVQRGPFTHLPHEHMACADCHGAAAKSKLTSDILLPPQALCAECHRPAVEKIDKAWATNSGSAAESHGLAAAQRQAGGVKWDCQSCHTFHAPPDAVTVTQSILAAEARGNPHK